MADYTEKEYWDARYKNGRDSGYGSYGEQLEKKLRWILNNVEGVGSITDVGCGDFNTGKNLLSNLPGASYHGYDISEEIIKKHRDLYMWMKFDTYTGQPLESADLVICLDVLFHIFNEEDVEALLSNLDKSFTKYLAITAYERDEDLNQHVRIRKFDYSRFGTPIIREIVEEDGELYFYLFKR